MTPRRRRRKLLLRGEADNNDYLVTMLSKAEPIYEKIDNSQTLTTAESGVVTQVDAFYHAYDGNDSESFNLYTCSPLSSESQGVRMDALEAALNTYLGI